MRLARFEAPDGRRYAGRLDGEAVVPLRADGPDAILDAAGGGPALMAALPLHAVRLLSPVFRPPSVRDFYAFERHVRTARALRGLDMDPDWYELPVFYFSSPARIFGPGDDIPCPRATGELDYELEFAWVISRDGSDLSPDEALDHVAGYTIFNDFSARDVQRREMKLSLGPAKGKDFASSFGPFLVTPDEFAPGGRPRGSMRACVNGREYSRADLADLHHGVGEMIAYASRDSLVRRGDVMGSGTCGTGCILELAAAHGAERYPWLRPGDVVELEVEGLGTLRNRVAPPREQEMG